MNIKKVFILLTKEVKLSSKRFIFIWAIITPFFMSILISLIFGSIFLRTPELGIYLEGESEIKSIMYEVKGVITKEYKSVDQLKNSVKNGIVDVGIIIPKDFDENLKNNKEVLLRSYIFGESYARNRAIIVVTLGNIIREIAKKEINLNIETETVGETIMPWRLRVYPLIVMVAIFFGGMFIPSTSIIDEKRKKTLDALKVSGIHLYEIIASKWIFGFIVSLSITIIIFIINNIFIINPTMLIIFTLLGAVMANFIGTILGIYLNDFATLLSFWKIGGIVLFFPVVGYLFPKIPEILSKFFPTYYIIKPILEIIERGVVLNPFFYISILIILNSTLYIILNISLRKKGEFL